MQVKDFYVEVMGEVIALIVIIHTYEDECVNNYGSNILPPLFTEGGHDSAIGLAQDSHRFSIADFGVGAHRIGLDAAV